MSKQYEWDLTLSSAKSDADTTFYTVLAVRKQDAQALSFSYLEEDERLEKLKGEKLTERLVELARAELPRQAPERKAKMLHSATVRV